MKQIGIKNEEIRSKAIQRLKEKGIILPTFEQMRNPDLIPEKVKSKLQNIGLWDFNPLNLFRISWKNQPQKHGGQFGKVNHLVLPKALTGIDANIVVLLGKWFPTGAHKVGAAYGCLAPRILTGEFDPSYHKAVWPSTGNYCRGGAFDSFLMGCEAVAILPEQMSKERFAWLHQIGAEVIATPGCESNVKEIYDKCWDIRNNRPDCVIFNQFDEFGNPAWHYRHEPQRSFLRCWSGCPDRESWLPGHPPPQVACRAGRQTDDWCYRRRILHCSVPASGAPA